MHLHQRHSAHHWKRRETMPRNHQANQKTTSERKTPARDHLRTQRLLRAAGRKDTAADKVINKSQLE